MKIRCLIGAVLIGISAAWAQQNREEHVEINATTRQYLIHVPPHYSTQQKYPLVMIFHGGGGNNKQIQQYMGMDAIADREGFITVYPQGLNKQWNDGREFKPEISHNDDVEFVKAMLQKLQQQYSIDTQRVFATGISNGGFFSIYLSYKLNEQLLAVAPVCASIPQRIFDEFWPKQPISVLLINGTQDPLVPYEGGEVGNRLTGSRGRCTSTEQTVERYRAINQTNQAPLVENIPNRTNADGCTAVSYTYHNNQNHTTIKLLKVINGGHTLPGGRPYLPKIIIGNVCDDFDGNETIWQFFKECVVRL
ncbi:MAG: PHB depolymerase family esterase [Spirosomataceae bacterium]